MSNCSEREREMERDRHRRECCRDSRHSDSVIRYLFASLSGPARTKESRLDNTCCPASLLNLNIRMFYSAEALIALKGQNCDLGRYTVLV